VPTALSIAAVILSKNAKEMVIDMFFFGKSDIGKKRFENEDSFIAKQICENVWLCAVCDGMGGANGGQVASSLAVREFTDSLENALAPDIEESRYKGSEADIPALLALAVKKANTAVYERAKGESGLSGMGTTLTAAFIIGGTLYAVNVGDSRLYLVENGTMSQITKDHSYVQYLVDMGKLTPGEAENNPNKNIITRAVGTEQNVEHDLYTLQLPGRGEGYILLCSDGLTNFVSAEDIVGVILSDHGGKKELEKKIDTLIKKANDNGGGDNITAVLIQL